MKKKTESKEPVRSTAKDKYSAEYWQSEITRAQNNTKRQAFRKNFQESIKLYNANQDFDDVARKINVWWYIVNTLLPAYISRTPKVEAELRRKTGAPVFNLAQQFLERATQYELDECIKFYQVGEQCANAFLLGGQAVLWARYEAMLGEKEVEYNLMPGDDGGFIGLDGKPYTGEIVPAQGDDGKYSVKEIIPSKEYEEAKLEYVHFEDYCETVCRLPNEITWRARRGYMAQDQVTKLFGSATAKKLKYESYPADTQRADRDENKVEGKCAIWNIWCEEQGKEYFIQDGGRGLFEVQTPELKFKNFYPCAVISASTDPNTTVPVSDYVHCRDQVLEVEQLTTRIFACLRAVRSNALANATLGDEIKKLFTGDLQVLLMKNWATHKGAGGLQDQIEYQNPEPYIKALQVLTEARRDALERLYEITKAADILRGVSDPQDTATAVQLKADWGSLSLKVRQRTFAEFLSEGVNKVTEIISEHFDPQHIYDICDGDSIMANAEGEQIPPEMYMAKYMNEIVPILKDDPTRRYHIEITTDSLVVLDERIDRQERVDLMASFGSFLQQSVPFIEQYPGAAPFMSQMMQFVVRTYRAGKELEGPMMNMTQIVTDAAAQKMQQQQQAPDPAQVDANTRMQIAQMEIQAKVQQFQMQMQQDQVKFQHEQFLAQVEGQAKAAQYNIEIEKLQLERTKIEADISLRIEEMKLKQQEIAMSAQNNASDAEIKSQKHAFDAINNQQKMELDQIKVQLTSLEQMAEERRLAFDSKIELLKLQKESNGDGKPKEQKMPPMNFNIHMPKGGKRKGVIKRTDGSSAEFEVGDSDE